MICFMTAYPFTCNPDDMEQTSGNVMGGVKNPYLASSDGGCIDLVSASTGDKETYRKRGCGIQTI